MIESAFKCDGCQTIYSEMIPPKPPPCETCREVAMEENQDAIRIFFIVRYQLIMGANGPVDVNHQAIHEAMELYQIKDRHNCFQKVLLLSHWWLGEITSKEKG